ncbi:MAG: hypothetical protein P9X26_08510 [Candidatus Stygibacter frigidus]|nr:hypothetical protein [Candidatus Stygibacter frigidus]
MKKFAEGYISYNQLQTNRKDLKSDEIWNIYVMLTRVEKAFRDLKTYLGLRPNYHQLEDRVDEHIIISILAYHLMHTIEYVCVSKALHQVGLRSRNWSVHTLMLLFNYQ